MATSGVTTFNPTLREIMDEAYDRAGVPMRTGYDFTTAVRSMNFMFASEFSNRGLNMYEFAQSSLSLVSPTSSYALPTDTIGVLEGAIRTNAGNAATQSDIVISGVSMSDYIALPNKLSLGRPTQYTVQRETSGPVIYFYQAPDTAQTYAFFYWRLRRTQDAGTNPAYTADVPFRFYDAVVAGLAFRIACKRPEVESRVPRLKADYDEALDLAQREDRDRSSEIVVPYIARIC